MWKHSGYEVGEYELKVDDPSSVSFSPDRIGPNFRGIYLTAGQMKLPLRLGNSSLKGSTREKTSYIFDEQ